MATLNVNEVQNQFQSCSPSAIGRIGVLALRLAAMAKKLGRESAICTIQRSKSKKATSMQQNATAKHRNPNPVLKKNASSVKASSPNLEITNMNIWELAQSREVSSREFHFNKDP